MDVGSVTQTGASVTVSISHPEETSRMVYMRYRELPEGDWSASQTETDAASLEAVLSGLTPGMGYEVQASLYETYPATDTQEQRFNTPLPAMPMELPTPMPMANTHFYTYPCAHSNTRTYMNLLPNLLPHPHLHPRLSLR